MLINSNGIIIRIAAKDISQSGRSTMGVRIMRVDEDANIVSFAKVIDEEEAIRRADEKPSKPSKADNTVKLI